MTTPSPEGDSRPDEGTPRDEDVEDIPEEDIEGDVPASYEIMAYGADYPVDGLARRMREDDITVPAFQRGFVWTNQQVHRFIESLLLGLPVPGIFVYKDVGTRQLVVIDGQQRLRSLAAFYEGLLRGREFILRGVHEAFNGRSYRTLEEADRRRLDDSIIPTTVVQQLEPAGDDSSVYHLFERLNTGGTRLQPQEIRTALYRGPFIELLGSLNEDSSWRDIFGPPSGRLKDQELILRFFALNQGVDDYERPMKEFLNKYARRNRHLDSIIAGELASVFTTTTRVVREHLGRRPFRPESALNVAVFDAAMVGIARRLSAGSIESGEELRQEYETLLGNADFQRAYERATADEESVKTRIRLATEGFGNIS